LTVPDLVMDEHKSAVMEHNARDHVRCRIRIFQRNDAGNIRIVRCAHRLSSSFGRASRQCAFAQDQSFNRQ
jgi:hypothetical protein